MVLRSRPFKNYSPSNKPPPTLSQQIKLTELLNFVFWGWATLNAVSCQMFQKTLHCKLQGENVLTVHVCWAQKFIFALNF